MYVSDSQLEDLKSLVGKEVRVTITEDGYSRRHFGPQIAVAGTLETKESRPGHYRVLVDDDTRLLHAGERGAGRPAGQQADGDDQDRRAAGRRQ